MSTPEYNAPMDESREHIPASGKTFSCIEDAETFYQNYGWRLGFSTRRAGSYTPTGCNVRTRQLFVCSFSGKANVEPSSDGPLPSSDGVVSKKKRKRWYPSSLRCGCKAKMKIALEIEDGTWVVVKFVEEHNHAMATPTKLRYLRANRRMPKSARDLTEFFHRAHLAKNKVPLLFAGSSPGGGFDARDCYNHMRNVRKAIHEKGDAASVIDWFHTKQSQNPGFIWSAQVDQQGRAANIFWVDARSRMSYIRFGESVTFDTTYRTNKYKMPFAPFTGVNHHNRSILFGFALLTDETEDTFEWLFRKWLEAMGGEPPVSMITDQDLAMTKAIAKVFPNTHHRFCLWHIKKKFGEKLATIFHKESEFKKRVKKVTRKSYTIEAFEEGWQAMLEEFELEDHDWLKQLYSIRHQWVPVYNRGTFFAGMNTTQRSESINAFFDSFVNSRTSLIEFVDGCDQALNKIYDKELKEDFNSIYKQRVFSCSDPMLRHAAKIYTKNIFIKLAKEFNRSWDSYPVVMGLDGDDITYRVTPRDGGGEYQAFIVKVNSVTHVGLCNCQKFTFVGLLCRHLHLVLSNLGVREIPPHFIKARWGKYANRTSVVGAEGVALSDGVIGSHVWRASQFCRRMMDVADIVGKSERGYNVAMEYLDKAVEEVNKILAQEMEEGNNGAAQGNVASETGVAQGNAAGESEPTQVDASQIIVSQPNASQGNVTSQPNASQAGASQPNGSQSEFVIRNPNVTVTKGRKKVPPVTRSTSQGDARIMSGMEKSQLAKEKKPRTCAYCKALTNHDIRNCPVKKADRETSVATQCLRTSSRRITDLTRDDGSSESSESD